MKNNKTVPDPTVAKPETSVLDTGFLVEQTELVQQLNEDIHKLSGAKLRLLKAGKPSVTQRVWENNPNVASYNAFMKLSPLNPSTIEQFMNNEEALMLVFISVDKIVSSAKDITMQKMVDAIKPTCERFQDYLKNGDLGFTNLENQFLRNSDNSRNGRGKNTTYVNGGCFLFRVEYQEGKKVTHDINLFYTPCRAVDLMSNSGSLGLNIIPKCVDANDATLQKELDANIAYLYGRYGVKPEPKEEKSPFGEKLVGDEPF